MKFAIKWRYGIMKACDSDITADAIAISHRRKWIGGMNGGMNALQNAIAKSQLEECHRGNHRRGPTQLLLPPTCDIASEGIQWDRKSENVIRGGFIKSEEVQMHRRESLMHRKGLNKVKRGFLYFGGV